MFNVCVLHYNAMQVHAAICTMCLVGSPVTIHRFSLLLLRLHQVPLTHTVTVIGERVLCVVCGGANESCTLTVSLDWCPTTKGLCTS